MVNQRPTEHASPTICLPISEEEYRKIMDSWPDVRRWIEESYSKTPELFPAGFEKGFGQKDSRSSKKIPLRLWRITLHSDDQHYSIRPSFVMPWMTARTDDVAKGLFARTFGMPYWATAYLFGHDPMFWYRLETGLGRNSLVGTTVRQATLPEDVVADEHHQTCRGEKIYIATTVADGCCLGAAVAQDAGTNELAEAYGVFRDEAQNVRPGYAPSTVNTDGWKSTIAAWQILFVTITVVRCFLHGWLKIRDRAKHMKDWFMEIGNRVWDAYHSKERGWFRRRLRALKTWAEEKLPAGQVRQEVLDLCAKEDLWVEAYDHPGCHRTSNMLDRVMRGMCVYFDLGQHLHGSVQASERRCRGWALLHNFAPWSPQAKRANDGYESPAERLNKHRYHTCWLQNLLISASLGGYRKRPPQNP